MDEKENMTKHRLKSFACGFGENQGLGLPLDRLLWKANQGETEPD
jgi:hypothetical protein